MTPFDADVADTPRLRPFAGFSTVFSWGIRRALRTRRFAVALVVCGLAGYGLGTALSHAHDPTASVWEFLGRGVIGFVVPLLALGLVGTGYGEEVSDRTLLYHLVRPVSRKTVYVARYLSGALPCALLAAVFGALLLHASGVGVSWGGTTAALAVEALALGAVYYALGALFERGLVAGLVYTFVLEIGLQATSGSIQSLGLTHHVRSLFHRLADAEFAIRSSSVAFRVRAQEGRNPVGGIFASSEPWGSVSSSLTVLGVVVALALLVGARVVSRRDFALKD